MTHMTLKEFDQRMGELLLLPEMDTGIGADILHNGLQTHGAKTISRVGFGVSASIELFRLAKKNRCQAVVVHHGIRVPAKHLDDITYERFAFLIKNDISLWSAHYALDAHPLLGNNVQLLNTIGANVVEPYYDSTGVAWGYLGEFAKTTTLTEIQKRLRTQISPRTIVYPFGKKQIKRVVCVTGGAAPNVTDLSWMMKNKVDLYITGEIHEWNREELREAGMNCIAGGHYHTETFGIKALQRYVTKDFGLSTVWLGLVNEV